MHLPDLLSMARREHLYPGVILHGGDPPDRHQAALELARTLLCEQSGEERPCGSCQQCRRIAWPGEDGAGFHPDVHFLSRDLRTATSAEATKTFLKQAYSAPFEARGQVFVIIEANTLSGEAADALLKILEEPPLQTPRHFLLLTASRLDLLPTLRSRSLSLYLGSGDGFSEEEVGPIAEAFGEALRAFAEQASSIYLLSAAEALAQAPGFEDPRARRPWALAATAVLRQLPAIRKRTLRRALLSLAEELLGAPGMRVRGIPQGRILEGLLARHLGGLT